MSLHPLRTQWFLWLIVECIFSLRFNLEQRWLLSVLTAICKWFTNLTEFIWSTNFFAVFQQWLARHSMFVHITFDQGWQRAKPMQWGHKLEKNFNWLVTIFESCFASFFDFMIRPVYSWVFPPPVGGGKKSKGLEMGKEI